MAINVYTPGCHLLCHDDVIGSRRVSYILYLTDPDRPWKAVWGGALRLYPTQTYTGDDGDETKVPSPDFSVSIPPAFNQLSFFAVQPGESFHDVEEVYARKKGEKEEDDDGGRVRMAISGWYHIPQEGEDGYEEGLEERLAEKSSLMQLQGKGDKYDLPQSQVQTYDQENGHASVDSNGKEPAKASDDDDDSTLTVADLDFLLEYLAPTYLTPDTLSSLSSLFADESSLRLSDVLSSKFSSSLRSYITSQEEQHPLDNVSSSEIEASTPWKVARPPHKHRFLFQQPSAPVKDSTTEAEGTPLHSLLNTLLPSRAFKKWLSLATGLTLTSHDIIARRFRPGLDYSLATGYNEDVSRLEVTLGITPTKGWGDDEEEKKEEEEQEGEKEEEGKEEEEKEEEGKEGVEKEEEEQEKEEQEEEEQEEEEKEEEEDADKESKESHNNATVANGSKKANDDDEGEDTKDEGKDAIEKGEVEPNSSAANGSKIPDPDSNTLKPEDTDDPAGVGGYEVYMAGDDDDDSTADANSDHGVPIPPTLASSNTGAKSSKPSNSKSKSKHSDPAIYHAATDGDDDDGVLFSMPAGWNKMSLVLRDRGVLRFVKFVSKKAEGGRWDVGGGWGVGDDDEGDEEEGEEEAEDEKVVEGANLAKGKGVLVGVGIGESESEEEEMGSGSDESSD